MTTSSVSRPPVSIQYIYIHSLLSMCVCAGYYYRVILRARSYRLLMCLMVAHCSKGVDCKSRTGWYRNERHLLPLFHLSCTHTHTYIYTHRRRFFSVISLHTRCAYTQAHSYVCTYISFSLCVFAFLTYIFLNTSMSRHEPLLCMFDTPSRRVFRDRIESLMESPAHQSLHRRHLSFPPQT